MLVVNIWKEEEGIEDKTTDTAKIYAKRNKEKTALYIMEGAREAGTKHSGLGLT